MTSVSKMSADERAALVQKLAGAVKENGLQEKVSITTYRESVAALGSEEIEDTFQIKVVAALAPEFKDQIEKLKADVAPMVEGIEGAIVKLSIEMGAGCQYDPIKNVKPIKGGDALTLEHTEGEVWLIDFWATWCPPCQAPMAHNQAMLEKRGGDWGDKVKIVCISIDQKADAVVSHVEKKGWEKPIHYHRAESDCSQQYGVNGVPHVMLIDTKGKIVFKGHPAGRKNLEEDFDTLLKGEEITGHGTESEAKPAAEGDDATAADAGKALNSTDALRVIDGFVNEVGPALQADLKETASGMPRAFCVMVYQEKYNIVTEKSSIDWKNYRVLVGKQEAIDKCKSKIDESVKGDFEVVLREQAI